MGFYADHVLPRGVAWAMGAERMKAHRRAALEGCAGRVLELGFGAGHNLDCYPEQVRAVLALDPATVNRKLAAGRIARACMPVEWVGLRGEQIPLDAASVDAVVSTWTMCSIPDLGAALGEVRRVLRPGGELFFVEHGAADEPRVLRRQVRWNGLQQRLLGGCHLDRRFDELLRDAGYELRGLRKYYMDGPKFVSFLYRGAARPN